jgi:hypothetical protein
VRHIGTRQEAEVRRVARHGQRSTAAFAHENARAEVKTTKVKAGSPRV